MSATTNPMANGQYASSGTTTQGHVVVTQGHVVQQGQVVQGQVATQGKVVAHTMTPEVKATAHAPQQEWAAGFCDCCSYMEVDEDGKSSCMWCPYFIPMGLCGTCFLLGRIQTLYVKEEKKCCDMGTEGCMCCLISTPINLCGPLGGFCWFALNSVNMRRLVVDRYNIKEDSSCPTLCIGFCFPLSLFQVLMKLRQLDRNQAL